MAVTIREVAAAAKVSPMAVSKVLHGKGANVRVSEETAERIRGVARELRYQPNHLARSLRTHRTQTIGLVFEHFERLGIQNGYDLQLLNGVMSVTYPVQYTLAICPKLVHLSDGGQIGDGRFDGVLWCKPDVTARTVQEMRNSNVPVVLMHVPPNAVEGLPSYCCDNTGALEMGVEHLYQQGHRRIVFVRDPDNEHTPEGEIRTRGFALAMRSRGLEADTAIWSADPRFLSAPEGPLSAYRDGKGPHTAVILFSEAHAVQVLATCSALGIDVPGDLSVVGFDSTPYCEVTTPKLTAIYQPIELMARDAAKLLLSLIEGEPAPQPLSVVYPCGFDVRESTAPPRS